MIESLINRVSQGWHRLFSSKHLLPHEQVVLNAWRASLPEAAQHILDTQLLAAYLVQRQAAGAKVAFYYDKGKEAPPFSNDQPDVHAATVSLHSEGLDGETMRVKVFVHRGRFFSIEFPKRPERYMQQHHMVAEKLRVAAVESHASL